MSFDKGLIESPTKYRDDDNFFDTFPIKLNKNNWVYLVLKLKFTVQQEFVNLTTCNVYRYRKTQFVSSTPYRTCSFITLGEASHIDFVHGKHHMDFGGWGGWRL